MRLPFCFGLPKQIKPITRPNYSEACTRLRQADMASVSSATLTRKNSPVRDAYKGSSGHHCAVVGCRNNQRKRSRLLRAFCGEHDTRRESCRCGIFSLHRFPAASRNPELRLQWIAAVNRKDYEPSEHARVCSEHFLDRKPSKQNPVPVLRLGYSKKLVKGRHPLASPMCQPLQCVAEHDQPSSDDGRRDETENVEDDVCIPVGANPSTLLHAGAQQADPAVCQQRQQPLSAHNVNTVRHAKMQKRCFT